ncbi:hypothetical protein ACJ72_00180 [Emergomyces africanus]|uniref:Uncharacterized protein n=1 Tax=Emergomyces africanus TaxID=1955775 RepID=A0A1B7P8T6_9EURO|nr:hypothetical protein ACJ72_00180 [Emergomyces africanus]
MDLFRPNSLGLAVVGIGLTSIIFKIDEDRAVKKAKISILSKISLNPTTSNTQYMSDINRVPGRHRSSKYFGRRVSTQTCGLWSVQLAAENDLTARIEILRQGWIIYSAAVWQVHKCSFFDLEIPQRPKPQALFKTDKRFCGRIIENAPSFSVNDKARDMHRLDHPSTAGSHFVTMILQWDALILLVDCRPSYVAYFTQIPK